MENGHSVVGKAVYVKSYKQICREYPFGEWNKQFFDYNGEKRIKLLEYEKNNKLFKCEINDPLNPNNKKVGYIDERVIILKKPIKLNENLFKM